jgi:glycosyltransferase involved in cell wall biosynthesis
LNILYCPTDIRCPIDYWSGTPFFLRRALMSLGKNILLPQSDISFLDLEIEIRYKQYADLIDATIRRLTDTGTGIDGILCLGSNLFPAYGHYENTVLYTDDCLKVIIDEFNWFDHVSVSIKDTLKELEKKAFQNCKRLVFSSNHARQKAVEVYPEIDGKSTVIPFGANIFRPPEEQEIIDLTPKKNREMCNLLFIGGDPDRKRLPYAYEVCVQLNETGIPARLHVVGVEGIDFDRLSNRIISYGYLHKEKKEEYGQLVRLLQTCHFLLLPSRYESFGIVLCEASAYGLPSMAAGVGGVPSVINERNGVLFDVDADANEYAAVIRGLYTDPVKYSALAVSTYREFSQRLNWEKSGEILCNTINIGGKYYE